MESIYKQKWEELTEQEIDEVDIEIQEGEPTDKELKEWFEADPDSFEFKRAINMKLTEADKEVIIKTMIDNIQTDYGSDDLFDRFRDNLSPEANNGYIYTEEFEAGVWAYVLKVQTHKAKIVAFLNML